MKGKSNDDRNFGTVFGVAKALVSEGRAKLLSAENTRLKAACGSATAPYGTAINHAEYLERAGIKKITEGLDIYAALLCYTDSSRVEKALISTIGEFKGVLGEDALGKKRIDYFSRLSDDIAECLGFPGGEVKYG